MQMFHEEQIMLVIGDVKPGDLGLTTSSFQMHQMKFNCLTALRRDDYAGCKRCKYPFPPKNSCKSLAGWRLVGGGLWL